MRRLVLLLSAIVALDIMFFAALAPLLPHFVSAYGLSKSAAGVLSATYAAGVLAASVPEGLAASRYGPRQAALGGVALTAAASLAFALSHDVPGCSAPPGFSRASVARSRGRARWPGSWPPHRAIGGVR